MGRFSLPIIEKAEKQLLKIRDGIVSEELSIIKKESEIFFREIPWKSGSCVIDSFHKLQIYVDVLQLMRDFATIHEGAGSFFFFSFLFSFFFSFFSFSLFLFFSFSLFVFVLEID